MISKLPDGLAELVGKVRYKDWRLTIEPAGLGWMLVVRGTPPDNRSRYQQVPIQVMHGFLVPPYEPGDWRVWLFERLGGDLERHEAMEAFEVDGERIFWPDHSPDGDPYALRLKENAR